MSKIWKPQPRLLMLAILAIGAGLGLSGCDDHVIVDRDATVAIRKGMTWAWRPETRRPGSDRHTGSRDVAASNRDYRRNPEWENDIVRNRIALAFEKNLNAKGLVQINDPANADFLVDFQYGVQPRRERVATPVYRPGLVCGYRGCWEGFYGPPGVVVRTIQFREGTIVFDLIERSQGKLAYRGIREKAVSENSFRQGDVNEGARHLLKGLKPTN
jgi:hypothetical protein